MKTLLIIAVALVLAALLVKPDEFEVAHKEVGKAAAVTVDSAKKVTHELADRVAEVTD